MNTPLKHIYRNLPNIVSIVGVLPLCILLRESLIVVIADSVSPGLTRVVVALDPRRVQPEVRPQR